jgi:hypothetical protein
MVPVDYHLVRAFVVSRLLLLYFMLIVTEPIDDGTSLALAGHSHYVNQEHLLQDTAVGADLETVSIRDDMGFDGTSSEILACKRIGFNCFM